MRFYGVRTNLKIMAWHSQINEPIHKKDDVISSNTAKFQKRRLNTREIADT